MNHRTSSRPQSLVLAFACLVLLFLGGCASPGSRPATAQPGPVEPRTSQSGSPGAARVDPEAGRSWSRPPAEERPGLATSFGETRDSRITRTRFKRQDSRPQFQTVLRYNDRAGLEILMAQGWRKPQATNCPLTWYRGKDFAYGLRGEDGEWLPSWTDGIHTYFEGRPGQRYAVVLLNPSPVRREVVVSVDGLDTMDGLPASLRKRGYILEPRSEFAVEGFRTSAETVAAFRFGSVANSYSERRHGTSRNVGVIGLAVFAENDRDIGQRLEADPFPGRWAAPPVR